MNDYRWDELVIGLAHRFEVVVTEAMLSRFVADSGDTNPLHTDPSYARAHGFSDVVLHGLLTSMFYSTLVGVYLPGRRALLQGADISFHKSVYAGQRLTVSGEVSYRNEAYRQAQLAATICSSEGLLLSKAILKVGVRD
jgi:3-hydroxybutyryl-CoA dehydratase